LRRPRQADTALGPTYNAAVNGAVYWKRFGASDTTEDRFPAQLGRAEVSSYQPGGRMDVTEVLTDATYGKTTAEGLRVLADCGFIVSKLEVYDARFYNGAYEFTIGTGPRAILIKSPQLVVTFKPGKAEKSDLPAPADVPADGACSMGRWAVKDSRAIDIRYHAFGGEYLPKEKDPPPATLLFITGTKGKPRATLNGRDVTAALKPWKQDGVDGWLVSLSGTFPKDETIAPRLVE
jgi:hypothetical protein